jgi:hypothetical protein
LKLFSPNSGPSYPSHRVHLSGCVMTKKSGMTLKSQLGKRFCQHCIFFLTHRHPTRPPNPLLWAHPLIALPISVCRTQFGEPPPPSTTSSPYSPSVLSREPGDKPHPSLRRLAAPCLCPTAPPLLLPRTGSRRRPPVSWVLVGGGARSAAAG